MIHEIDRTITLPSKTVIETRSAKHYPITMWSAEKNRRIKTSVMVFTKDIADGKTLAYPIACQVRNMMESMNCDHPSGRILDFVRI